MRARRPGRHSDEVMGPRALAAMADAAALPGGGGRAQPGPIGCGHGSGHCRGGRRCRRRTDRPRAVGPGHDGPVQRPGYTTPDSARGQTLTIDTRPTPHGGHTGSTSSINPTVQTFHPGPGTFGDLSDLSGHDGRRIGIRAPAPTNPDPRGPSAKELDVDRVGEPDGDRGRSTWHLGGQGRWRWITVHVKASRHIGPHRSCCSPCRPVRS